MGYIIIAFMYYYKSFFKVYFRFKNIAPSLCHIWARQEAQCQVYISRTVMFWKKNAEKKNLRSRTFLASHNDFMQSIVILAHMFSSLTSNLKDIKRITTNHVTYPTVPGGQILVWAHTRYHRNSIIYNLYNQYIIIIKINFCRRPLVTSQKIKIPHSSVRI